MKKNSLRCYSAFLFCLIHLSAFSQTPKTKVLVLGTYHMDNPGLDKFNMQADDITSPKRQKEVEEFVNALAAFKPTKICIEYSHSKNDKLNLKYGAYKNGNAELTKNEIDQIGFRLAKKLNHKEVFAIDATAPFEMDTVIALAQKANITKFLTPLGKIGEFIEEMNQQLYKKTVKDYFKYLNEPGMVRAGHQFYLAMAAVSQEENYTGPDLVADWYKRNLRIYANITHIATTPQDRILILYGSGHSKILQDLIEDSSDYELVLLKDIVK